MEFFCFGDFGVEIFVVCYDGCIFCFDSFIGDIDGVFFVLDGIVCIWVVLDVGELFVFEGVDWLWVGFLIV